MIKYLSLFSGIGAFEKALDNLGVPFELLASNGISKTQIYKMAGNSIVVTVLEHLFKQIYHTDTQSVASLKKKTLDILNNL